MTLRFCSTIYLEKANEGLCLTVTRRGEPMRGLDHLQVKPEKVIEALVGKLGFRNVDTADTAHDTYILVYNLDGSERHHNTVPKNWEFIQDAIERLLNL